MLQRDHLLEWRSIHRNVLLGLKIQGELKKDNLSYVDELLKLCELDKFRDKSLSQTFRHATAGSTDPHPAGSSLLDRHSPHLITDTAERK